MPLERQEWSKLEVKDPRGHIFIADRTHVIREWSELDLKDITGVSLTPDGRRSVYGTSGYQEAVYSFEYLQSGGNIWMQALDKRDIESRAISTSPYDLFHDDQSGNLIVAMGLQGVVVLASDGIAARIAVGRYAPTDFSFSSKVRTFVDSLLHLETVASTGLALLLVFSYATLTIVGPAASAGPRICFVLAVAMSTLLAVLVGVYPHVLKVPWEAGNSMLEDGALVFSGFGLFPFLLVVVGLVVARPSRRLLLAIGAATVGMLALIALGALVLFETGPGIANVVAVGLVGVASLGLWAYQRRRQT